MVLRFLILLFQLTLQQASEMSYQIHLGSPYKLFADKAAEITG